MFSDYRTGEQVITLGSVSAVQQYKIDYKTQNGGTVNKKESKQKEKYQNEIYLFNIFNHNQ